MIQRRVGVVGKMSDLLIGYGFPEPFLDGGILE